MRPQAPAPFRAISALSGVVLLFCGLFFLVYPRVVVPRFAALFADFGDTPMLPLATRVAMTPATSWAVLLFLFCSAVAGALRPRERPIILSLAAGGGIALGILAVVALYLPLMALAAQIK